MVTNRDATFLKCKQCKNIGALTFAYILLLGTVSEVHLSCSSGLLVIESAVFQPNPERRPLNCSLLETHSQPVGGGGTTSGAVGLPWLTRQPGDLDIQGTLNQRCSGFTAATDCRFNLLLDHEAATGWGPGVVRVWHRCVPASAIATRCGTVLQGSGFIMSTSYPKYYMGSQVCSWKVMVEDQAQLVLVTLVDLHLEGAGQRCRDQLSLGAGGGSDQLALCGELRTKVQYISDSSVLVSFNTSASQQYIHPSRGFLLEYTTLSCSPPPSLRNAPLLTSNQTHATYRCHSGLVFNHSRAATATLLCSGLRLEPTVPRLECTATEESSSSSSSSTPSSVLLGLQDEDYLGDPGLWFQEVVLPLVLLSFLLIMSLAGLILLTLARRHRAEEERLRQIYTTHQHQVTLYPNY